jgi:predicted SprT family Zn-dependent metalloprotease
MANDLNIKDLEYSPSCGSCGSEYITQEDIDTLVYSRTTASADVYYCTDCKEESIQIFFTRNKK